VQVWVGMQHSAYSGLGAVELGIHHTVCMAETATWVVPVQDMRCRTMAWAMHACSDLFDLLLQH